jgi:hypothetical protein
LTVALPLLAHADGCLPLIEALSANNAREVEAMAFAAREYKSSRSVGLLVGAETYEDLLKTPRTPAIAKGQRPG